MIELLTSVAIIAAMTVVMLDERRKFMVKARRAAVSQQMHQVRLLLDEYANQHGSYPVATASNPYISWDWVIVLTSDDFSSKDSCNVPNPLNFTVPDCTKQDYYLVIRSGKPTAAKGRFQIVAGGFQFGVWDEIIWTDHNVKCVIHDSLRWDEQIDPAIYEFPCWTNVYCWYYNSC